MAPRLAGEHSNGRQMLVCSLHLSEWPFLINSPYWRWFAPITGTAITQRLKLNDVGSQNGEFQVWVDGESIMNIVRCVYHVRDARC